MAFTFVDGAEVFILGYLTNRVTTTRDLVLRLFKSNTTPAETDTAGTYTEATFTGYSSITLTGASWSAANPSTYAQQTFTLSATISTENVYGYYMTRATDADLVLAERFSDGPYAMTNNGDNIKVTPSIGAS